MTLQNKKTCSTCAAWHQKPDDKMTPLGYGCCPHLPAGQYLVAAASCRLPNKFKVKP